MGLIYGPCLFVVFINDMPEDIRNKIQLFADDTKLYGQATESLQEDVNKLTSWSERWQLKFNKDKCKVAHLGRNNPNQEYTMKHDTRPGERDTTQLLVTSNSNVAATAARNDSLQMRTIDHLAARRPQKLSNNI